MSKKSKRKQQQARAAEQRAAAGRPVPASDVIPNVISGSLPPGYPSPSRGKSPAMGLAMGLMSGHVPDGIPGPAAALGIAGSPRNISHSVERAVRAQLSDDCGDTVAVDELIGDVRAVDEQEGRTRLEVHGELNVAVAEAARLLKMDAGAYVRRAMDNHLPGYQSELDEARRGGVPLDDPNYTLSSEGSRSWLELWPDGDPDGELMRLKVPVRISYIGLANLIAVSKAMGFDCRLTEDGVRLFSRTHFHQVVGGWRMPATEDRAACVRLALALHPSDAYKQEPVPVLQDVPLRTWESLVGEGPMRPAGSYIDLAADIQMDDGWNRQPQEIPTGDRPVWAGARAFDKVWDRAAILAAGAEEALRNGEDVMTYIARKLPGHPWRDGARSMAWSVRAVFGYALNTMLGLRNATEVLCDPEQLMLLPDFDSIEQAAEFAQAVALPFEGNVFLDMEGAARSCVTVTIPAGHEVVVRGAMVSRPGDGTLLIAPYGHLRTTDMAVDAEQTYNSLGAFAFGLDRERRMPTGIGTTTNVMDNGMVFSTYAVDPAAIPFVYAQDAPPDGWEPSSCCAYTLYDAADDRPAELNLIAAMAEAVTTAAMVALKTLWLMNMGNVEIVDAPLTRQWRREAARKQQRIALAVHVHVNRKQYASSADGAHAAREYSHRFRVRAHVKHFQVGTRMADADPGKVKPCPRCGRCRQVFTPSFIKGPDNRPLVLKSLVLDDH